MNTPAPSTPLNTEERLEAMEFLFGQILLGLEADSVTMHERIGRLEATIARLAPGSLPALPEEHEDTQPFTMNGLGDWMQMSLERMRSHRSVSAHQMVAIGELTARVLDLGESLVPEQAPAIGQDALAAVEKAKRPPSQD